MSAKEWKPRQQLDSAVREWMAAKGLPVNSTRYYVDEEVYAWRHESGGGSPTLWVARPALEAYDTTKLLAALDRLDLAERMRAAPMARFMVVDEDGELCATPWPHRPHRGG